MPPKPSDLQEYDFKTDVTEEPSEETLSAGYHDNGSCLKLLLYQKLIIGPSSMFVPSIQKCTILSHISWTTETIDWKDC